MQYQDAILKIVLGLFLSGVIGFLVRFVYLKKKYENENLILRYDNEIKNLRLDVKNNDIDTVIGDVKDNIRD